MLSTSADRRSTTVPVASFGGGVAMLASGFLPWIRSGSGSTYRGLELADALRTGPLTRSWGTGAAVGIYLCSITGAVLVASTGWRTAVAGAARIAVAVAVLGAAGFLQLSQRFPLNKWDVGPGSCLAGAVLVGTAGAKALDGRARR